MTKKQIAYNFIKEETSKVAKIYSYHEADGIGVVLVFPSGNTFGWGYSNPFATLEGLRDNDGSDYEGQLLRMFSAESENPTKNDLEEFIEAYENEVENCNTSHKEEFKEKLRLLKSEVKAFSF